METITVGTFVDCNTVELNTVYPESTCRHNVVGCHFIKLFEFMHNLNVSYIFIDSEKMSDTNLKLLMDGTIDVYARPVSLRTEILDSVYPVQAIFMWRVGFIFRREHKQRVLRKFYRKPFDHTVWFSLVIMTVLSASIFFILSRWEAYLGLSQECSFVFELLLAIGGFCQHICPVETTTISRRTAYFAFFLFSYVIYTSFTSNLLSYIVSDKEEVMTLDDLTQSDYNYMFLDGIKEYHKRLTQSNASVFRQSRNIPVVNISTGLEAVRTNKTALLSDYSLVYKAITNTFSNEEICDIVEVDLFSRIHKYLVTSKTFRYKEQIRVSTLRMQETGILERLAAAAFFTPLECSADVEFTTSIEQIVGLLLVLLGCYILAVFILLCEIIHSKRYRLWPYVE